jgi:branched-chain amino acid transport system substrate-binding protein
LGILTLVLIVAAACGDEDTPTPAPTTPTPTQDAMMDDDDAMMDDDDAMMDDDDAMMDDDDAMMDDDDAMMDDDEEKAPIKIGAIHDLTGPAQDYGTVFFRSIDLAADEINAAGGIDGHQIDLIVEDGKCNASDALTAFTKLVEVDEVSIVLGASCSGAAMGFSPEIDKNEILVISIVSTNDFSFAGDYAFRNAPDNAALGEAPAAAAIADGYTTVATLTHETDFAAGWMASFTEMYESLGGTILTAERARVDDTDYRPVLTKMIAEDPQALVIITQTLEGCGASVIQARELGWDGRIYAGDTCLATTSLEIGGEAITDVRASNLPEVAKQKGKNFLANALDRFGFINYPFFEAANYDQLYIIKQCVEEEGADLFDTASLRDCLYAIEGFDGAAGTYGFDENGDAEGMTADMFRVLPVAERTQDNFGSVRYEPGS